MSASHSQNGAQALRVLGWPAFGNRAEQPYNWLLYSHLQALGVEVEEYSLRRALSGDFSVLHLHWPDRRVRDRNAVAALARSGALLALLDAARARGVRVVWTVHNLEAHEGRRHAWLEPRFWRGFTRRLDGILSLSPSGLDAIRERHPALRRTPGFVTPHGHYRSVYPCNIGREEARALLGLSGGARIIGFFGQLRPYKNVIHLVRVFRSLNDPNTRLLIAGRPKPEALADEIHAAAEGDPRVHLVPAFVPDEEVQRYFRAADLLVLPYREILNSGSAMFSLSFDRPVLVPRKGAMADLAEQVGPRWVRTYEGELAPETLGEALAWAATLDRGERPPLQEMEWPRIAQLTLEAYRALGARVLSQEMR